MFAPLTSITPDLTIYFQGYAIPACHGETVAAALLRAGVRPFRKTPVSGAPRMPFCMIGHCFECLVDIDETPDQQACLTLVADGMQVMPSQKENL